MGYIKEPVGVDFVVDSKPLTKEEKKRISEIIAFYKTTGKKLSFKHNNRKNRVKEISTKK